MNKNDARSLDHKTLTELRKRAVTSVHYGQSPEKVALALGINRVTIYGWLAKYREGGWGGLDAHKRGGRRPKLDGKALKWIYKVVVEKNPRQLKFPFALWTSKMVGDVITNKFGIKLSKASVCRLLNQLGLSAQRPLWRAYQQRPADVERWLQREYPRIKAMAKKVNARIYFGDEAGLRSDHHAGTTWAPKGTTPIVSTTGSRFSLNIISAVSAQGEFRFMIKKGTIGAKVFLEFIKRLIENADRPIFLIVDGHPAHKAKCVKKYIAEVGNRFKLFYLPPYSPELNPDERVWNDLKNNGIGRKAIKDKDELKHEVISYLRFIQKTPSRVRAYFQNEPTKYAA